MLEQRLAQIDAKPIRFAVVDHDRSWLRTPLHWRLRIWGQGVGGYAPAEGSVSRYSQKDRAERAGQIWLETGVYPAEQSQERTDA